MVVINDHLLILDSDLNARYDKALENDAQTGRHYKIFAPFAGPFFILEHGHYKREVIDSRNFMVMENLDGQNFKIRDISGDTVIVLQDGEEYRYLSLKQIGGEWSNIGYVNRRVDVGFAYDDILLVKDFGTKEVQVPLGSYSLDTPNGKIWMSHMGTYRAEQPIWFSIKNRQRSDPVFYERNELFNIPMSARRAPAALVHIFKESGTRLAFDFTDTYYERFEVYDLVTQKRLLKTRNRLSHHILDGALSGDGRRLAVLTDDRLELYIVPAPSVPQK